MWPWSSLEQHTFMFFILISSCWTTTCRQIYRKSSDSSTWGKILVILELEKNFWHKKMKIRKKSCIKITFSYHVSMQKKSRISCWKILRNYTTHNARIYENISLLFYLAVRLPKSCRDFHKLLLLKPLGIISRFEEPLSLRLNRTISKLEKLFFEF